MLDFGFSEILLTSAIALVVLGPERLPKVARQVGNWMGRARLMARQLSEQLEREVNAEEILRTQAKALMADPPRPALAPPPGIAETTGTALPLDTAPLESAPLPVDRYQSVYATSAAGMHQETSAAALHPATPSAAPPDNPPGVAPNPAAP